MSKPRRGKNIRSTENWRGTCPLCKRTGVKLLWTAYNADEKEMNVCKHCGK